MGYVMDKKIEHAVIVIQRTWRRLKAEREYRRVRLGLSKERQDYEKTEEDIERIRRSKEEYERLVARLRNEIVDDFYD